MTEYRNNKSEERNGMNGSRFRDVPTPARTDGVGGALRRAFAPVAGSEDFTSLLNELDRRTSR